MIDIWMRAQGQRLTLENPEQNVVRGTRNMLRLQFVLSAEWDGMAVAAVFRDGEAVVLERGACMVPPALCDGSFFDLKLVGKRGEQVYTTNFSRVKQVE